MRRVRGPLGAGHPAASGRARVHLRHSRLAAPLLCADSLGNGAFPRRAGRAGANGVRVRAVPVLRLRGLQPHGHGRQLLFRNP
ncbi:hypothetical protein NE583_11020, partial [Veillonella parvula]|uniref:hypothetical protein n=1 Tax=Veillonella parvula TaxID=29466 RepID=UPI00210DB885